MATSGSGGIGIQERDLDVLAGLFECRVMSLRHVAALHFGGKQEAAKKRVQKLKAAGYLRERGRRIGDPSLLHITKKAYALLRQEGRLDRFPHVPSALVERRAEVSELTLRHELAVMDVKAALTAAISLHPSLSLAEFSTWPALFQFSARPSGSGWASREVLVKPDGFIRIREKDGEGTFEHSFFVELDRSTESNEVLAQKAACYLDFYQSGGFAVRSGGSREGFREFPFRVLVICKNDERRNNIAERLFQNNPPTLAQVWLTTHAEILVAPLGEIWMRTKDYLETTFGTRFAPDKSRIENRAYRRQHEREKLTALRLRKLPLI